MRTRITHPQATTTTTAAAALAAGCAGLLLVLTGCDSSSAAGPSASATTADAKNGDRAPVPLAPVPRGEGSRVPYDFNGDGHRDLVVNDLVKAPEDLHGDDAGIGIVYGTEGSPLDPAVRQLLNARANAAKSGDTLPAAFDAEAACDLDRDGFTDLVVSTDPPYNGVGAPPVPLQILFGSPEGLTGKAVTLRIPAQARYGKEWPEHPVCGDFDGDGSTDLAVTASDGRISFLRGPFTRAGAPSGAELLPDGGPYLYAPEPEADTDGDGYDDLVATARPRTPGKAAKGTLLLGSADGPARPGGPYTFAPEELPEAPLRTKGATRTTLLAHGDFGGADGDSDGGGKKTDTVVRTYRGERQDLVALYAAGTTDDPVLTFSTTVFLP
ncbi:VCBS repeat-containing protein [Streptomyces microflavus]|uniref:FG-GAP repeat domain-containing protein n=1 Tax=Streptomyces microflavus TaxID=1919 RepID=UPI002255751F|nr:VCBS repeat-containing protein [Streptomyces microflavus]MCX4653403.1 VCBS repeat-containing protein [Streptomyces microflavus]WSA61639.1 VCBS repeat-containing protein [Streptomyces microflavus]